MKKKERHWIFIGVLVTTLILIFWFQSYKRNSAYHYNATPTVFVHGWNGSARSTNLMIDAAKNNGAAHKTMTVSVSPKGALTFDGYWDKNLKNPIIQVIFLNNRAGEYQDTIWLNKILSQLKHRYQISKVNLVGHSMGAYASANYTMMYSPRKNHVKVNKLVCIAGPFDGLVPPYGRARVDRLKGKISWVDRPKTNHLEANGKPEIIYPEYEHLLKYRSQFPRETRVLNIYGELYKGAGSDGVVTTTSARSLGYLVKPRAKSYQVKKIVGSNAQHSQLHHNNQQVDQTLINFLWQN